MDLFIAAACFIAAFITMELKKRYFIGISMKPAVMDDQGIMVLKTSRAYGIAAAVIGFSMASFLLIRGAQAVNWMTWRGLLLAVVIIFFGAVGMINLLEVFNRRLEADTQEIRYCSWYGRTIEIEWQEIQEVEWTKRNELFIQAEKAHVRLGLDFRGLLDFTDFIKKNLDREIFEQAVQDMYSVYNRHQDL